MPEWQRRNWVLNRATLSVPCRPVPKTSPLTWPCQKRIDNSRRPALSARNNNRKSWQLVYQPISHAPTRADRRPHPGRSLLFCSICGCSSSLVGLPAGFLGHLVSTQPQFAADHFGINRLSVFQMRTRSRGVSPGSAVPALLARVSDSCEGSLSQGLPVSCTETTRPYCEARLRRSNIWYAAVAIRMIASPPSFSRCR